MNEKEAVRAVKDEYREVLKYIAYEIREMKNDRKNHNNGYVHGLFSKRYKARHMHIAICELRGIPYEKIEEKCHENNLPNRREIKRIKEQFEDRVSKLTTEEAVIEVTPDASKKLYVLVRRDLDSKGAQAIQAGHAAIKYVQNNDCADWDNTLVYLYVKDKDSLFEYLSTFGQNLPHFESFCEPDLNNELTAIATLTDRLDLFEQLILM